MAWVEENETKGQEAYRMDRVEGHRKVDTEAKSGDQLDGREPELSGVSEFVRDGRTNLEDQFGSRVDSKRPTGQNG